MSEQLPQNEPMEMNLERHGFVMNLVIDRVRMKFAAVLAGKTESTSVLYDEELCRDHPAEYLENLQRQCEAQLALTYELLESEMKQLDEDNEKVRAVEAMRHTPFVRGASWLMRTLHTMRFGKKGFESLVRNEIQKGRNEQIFYAAYWADIHMIALKLHSLDVKIDPSLSKNLSASAEALEKIASNILSLQNILRNQESARQRSAELLYPDIDFSEDSSEQS